MLANYLLNMLGDRMEMAHSIEGRVPFLDHKVVELVRDLPVSMKIRGMTEKYVLREAAKPFITETIYRRQKHPFLAPPSGLEQTGRLSQLMQDTLRGPVLQNRNRSTIRRRSSAAGPHAGTRRTAAAAARATC